MGAKLAGFQYISGDSMSRNFSAEAPLRRASWPSVWRAPPEPFQMRLEFVSTVVQHWCLGASPFFQVYIDAVALLHVATILSPFTLFAGGKLVLRPPKGRQHAA
jgi:hypothetical protein